MIPPLQGRDLGGLSFLGSEITGHQGTRGQILLEGSVRAVCRSLDFDIEQRLRRPGKQRAGVLVLALGLRPWSHGNTTTPPPPPIRVSRRGGVVAFPWSWGGGGVVVFFVVLGGGSAVGMPRPQPPGLAGPLRLC